MVKGIELCWLNKSGLGRFDQLDVIILLTLKSRYILQRLRLIREHCTRVKADAKTNFKAGIAIKGGSPKASEHRTVPH